jgi:cysteinyl-tRNA synthetase
MDIIRRILEGYFGYHVNFVQNVTDIDDKVVSINPMLITRLLSVLVRITSGKNISNRTHKSKMSRARF